MGSVWYGVKVSGEGDIDAARDDVWREARRFITGFLRGAAYASMTEYFVRVDQRRVLADRIRYGRRYTDTCE
jgi:hypothetical protein